MLLDAVAVLRRDVAGQASEGEALRDDVERLASELDGLRVELLSANHRADEVAQERASLALRNERLQLDCNRLLDDFEAVRIRSDERMEESAELLALESRLELLEEERRNLEKKLRGLQETVETLPWRAIRVYRFSKRYIPAPALQFVARRISRRQD
jgi:chromosome segregation ATPase